VRLLYADSPDKVCPSVLLWSFSALCSLPQTADMSGVAGSTISLLLAVFPLYNFPVSYSSRGFSTRPRNFAVLSTLIRSDSSACRPVYFYVVSSAKERVQARLILSTRLLLSNGDTLERFSSSTSPSLSATTSLCNF
jgi:hypothetical protein